MTRSFVFLICHSQTAKTPSLHMPACIALATGGTAGHVTPALAVAEALRQRCPDLRLLFLGSAGGFEARLLAEQGDDFAPLPAAPLHGVGGLARLRALERLAAGVGAARRRLRAADARLVIGFGGYASAGAVLAARSLGLASVVHEANARPGVANRLLARVAGEVCVTWPESAAWLPASARPHHTGMPIRAAIAAAAPHPAPPGGRLRLLVCGGSLGSRFLNRHGAELAAALAARRIAVEVWHQAGGRPLEEVEAAYAAVGVAARVEAHVDDIAAAYAWADCAVSCAGAATLAELAAAGLPALLVPLATASDDHQADNAAAFAAATAGPWTREAAWNAVQLAGALAPLAAPAEWTAQSRRVRAIARPDAAEAVAAVCMAALK